MEKIKSVYKTVGEWIKADPNAYSAAKRNGWLTKIREECGWAKYTPKGNWLVKENCINEALKYKSKKEWDENSCSSYNSARKHEWLPECCAHMVVKNKIKGYWTKEHCIEEAKKYKKISKWKEKSSGSYQIASRNCWILECTKHMINSKKPNRYWWIKENCINEAKKYKKRFEWKKNSNASYTKALELGYFDECIKHMKISNKKMPNGHWLIKENCIAVALTCKTKAEFQRLFSGAHNSAYKNGFIEDCAKHMKKHGSQKN